MWDIVTKRGRQVVNLAQQAARSAGTQEVGTEHLLLGLCRVRQQDTIAAGILECLGIDWDAVEDTLVRELEQMQAASAPRPVLPDGALMHLTDQAHRCLELSRDEAARMGGKYIGAEHLALAVIRAAQSAQAEDGASELENGSGNGRDGDEIAARALASVDADLDQTRLRVQNLMS